MREKFGCRGSSARARLTALKSIAECHLYGIVDLAYVAPACLEQTTELMIAGGVDILQLRAKEAGEPDIHAFGKRIAGITHRAGVPLIVNDHPNLVPLIGADGAHVGQDDLPVAIARRDAGAESRFGTSPIIGKSTHTFVQAVAAENEGADYIGFGPLFATATKAGRPAIGLEEIARVQATMRIPVFCIGGVKRENLQAVLEAGARRVAIVSGILQAANILSYCRDVKAQLQSNFESNVQ